MDATEYIAILASLLVAVIGWMLYHNSRCSDFHERVAKLEEWQRAQERREGQR